MTGQCQAEPAECVATRCLHCGAYVDPMNGEAIVRLLSDGTEIWCNEQHAAAWVLAGDELYIEAD